MKLSGLLDFGEALPAFNDLLEMLRAGAPPSEPLGLYHAARPYLTALLARGLKRPLLVVTQRSSRVRQWVDELRTWLPDEVPVHFFADPDALPYERIPWAPETRQRRLEGLVSLLTWEDGGADSVERGASAPRLPVSASHFTLHAPLIVASARALVQMTLPVRELRAALRPVRQGQFFDLHKLLASWVGLGYEAVPVVEAPGQFSRRGGIVDIWPANLRKPLRIELFGDEIDSLRTFDPSTQRTIARAEQAWIGPASEALPKHGAQASEKLAALSLAACHPPARNEYEREIAELVAGGGCRNLEWYIPYLYSQPASLLDYLPPAGWLLLDDAAEVIAALGDLEGQAIQLARDLAAAGDVPPDAAPGYFGIAALRQRLVERASLLLGNSTFDGWAGTDEAPLASLFAGGQRYGGQLRNVLIDIERGLKQQARIVMVSRQAPRLAELLGEAGHPIVPAEDVPTLPPPGLTLVQGVMEEGWILEAGSWQPEAGSWQPEAGSRQPEAGSRQPEAGSRKLEAGSWKLETGSWKLETGSWKLETGSWKLEAGSWKPGSESQQADSSNERLASSFWFLTDAELFGWGKPKPRRPRRTRAVAPEVFFADVSPGDYVVHMEHGIGQFRGLFKMALDGVEREYLQIDYAKGDQLFVPVHQADRLARYVGAGDGTPLLHRLGTADWEQVKARARRAVAEIADELLELYAAREVVQGHAFSPDAPWQAELEASFPYVETEDQLVAVEAVKHDMEQSRPMDRLICGDVGYGKTEVALRAAFKAIMDGKQVAVLVPTTVLAQQHYTNFLRRLSAFPVTVDMLSRFRTPAQQDRALAGLVNGQVDLVVGTHRLLSKDVVFKDLGLLIVDEEQRFGVPHKERIKQMRTEVDVLTLTATPIPRTLHMSLTGVRDLSTIETPPEERLPVKTFVGEYDETLIRQAVLRELDRNGQVYFVHNRVQGIEQMAARLGRIVPEASIAVGHGQMPERELSAVMLAFAEGEYDILVCTSIIESGLDIPNVNTIIINRADQFGLAQLYQLRGRVGRSATRAYAYMLVDRYKTLTADARRRLEAIQEASELGAGFRIAMHDLEIRGAGELLGARQHGHIAAVGFDLYTRLLAQAVAEAKERATMDDRRLPDDAGGRGPSSIVHRRNLLEDPLAPTVQLDLNLPARIPEDYVPEAALRLQLYRRLAGLTTLEAVDEIAQEFSDRFGPVPEQVQNLLYMVRVKVLAVNARVEAISQEDDQWLFKSIGLETADRAAVQDRLKAQGVPARVARRGIWLAIREDDLWQRDLIKTLEALRG